MREPAQFQNLAGEARSSCFSKGAANTRSMRDVIWQWCVPSLVARRSGTPSDTHFAWLTRGQSGSCVKDPRENARMQQSSPMHLGRFFGHHGPQNDKIFSRAKTLYTALFTGSRRPMATSIRSWPTVRVRESASFNGIVTISVPRRATILPKSLRWTASMAPMP